MLISKVARVGIRDWPELFPALLQVCVHLKIMFNLQDIEWLYPLKKYELFTQASGPSKQLKQMIQIEHNIVRNPNWSEANQLAIFKCGRGFELGATVKQIQIVVKAEYLDLFHLVKLLYMYLLQSNPATIIQNL